MTAVPMHSMASKPTRSSAGSIGYIIAVLMRVAHNDCCPSRNVVSMMFTLLITLRLPHR